MSELENQITEDMKEAMKNQDRERLSVIRMLRSEIKNAEIESRSELTDNDILEVISREVKKCRESLDEYQKYGETEKVEKLNKELEILMKYMPEQLSEDEIEKIIRKKIDEVAAKDMRDMGKVMGAVMPEVKGQADGRVVNEKVKELLQKM